MVLKVAPTLREDCMPKVQLAVPVQAPVQPMNVESLAGVAVSVTDVLSGKVAEQVLPQLMPPDALMTDPVPVPSLVTVRVLLPVEVSAGKKVCAAFCMTCATRDGLDPKSWSVPKVHPMLVKPPST